MADITRAGVRSSEEFDEAVDELMAIADEYAQRLKQVPGRVFTKHPSVPDVDDILRANLRAALEDEVVEASALEDSAEGISSSEVQRELTKKALVGLRLSRLRELAQEHGLPKGGVAEEVATRIAKAYNWDSSEVARLVLQNEEEPSEEHAAHARMFPLAAATEIPPIVEAMEWVTGRYIRVGIARWFVFERFEYDEDLGEVIVEGSYRAYSVDVSEADGEASLVPHPGAHASTIHMSAHPMVIVEGPNVQVAKASMRAIEVAGQITRRGYAVSAAGALTSDIHPWSVFLLDILYTRLRALNLGNLNLTVARFKVRDDEADDEEMSGERPTLKAVRFEGRHLLDSVQACRLLYRDRRPLTDIAFLADYKYVEEGTPKVARFPIRIAIESDHIMVSTGFGTLAERHRQVQRAVMEAVRLEVENGVADEVRMSDLKERIAERSAEPESPASATLFADNDDDNVVPG